MKLEYGKKWLQAAINVRNYHQRRSVPNSIETLHCMPNMKPQTKTIMNVLFLIKYS